MKSILKRASGSLYVFSSEPSSESIVHLHEAMTELETALPCSFSVNHSNVIGNLSCGECSPFDVIDCHFAPAQEVDKCDSMTNYAFDVSSRAVEDECAIMSLRVN